MSSMFSLYVMADPHSQQAALEAQHSSLLRLPTGPTAITAIERTYKIVWSDVWNSGSEQDNQGSCRIFSYRYTDRSTAILLCRAELTWRDKYVEFDGEYDTLADRFSDFLMDETTMDEEDWVSVRLGFRRRDRFDGGSVRETVRDDNGQVFMMIYIDFGYKESVHAHETANCYGKLVREGDKAKDVKLSEQEQKRLHCGEEL